MVLLDDQPSNRNKCQSSKQSSRKFEFTLACIKNRTGKEDDSEHSLFGEPIDGSEPFIRTVYSFINVYQKTLAASNEQSKRRRTIN